MTSRICGDNGHILKWSDGDMFWYQGTELHRYYGPATRWSRKWYLHGTYIK